MCASVCFISRRGLLKSVWALYINRRFNVSGPMNVIVKNAYHKHVTSRGLTLIKTAWQMLQSIIYVVPSTESAHLPWIRERKPNVKRNLIRYTCLNVPDTMSIPYN